MTQSHQPHGTTVYLVMSHTAPEQVIRLVRTIRALSPSAPVVIHHDASRVTLDTSLLERLGPVHVLYAEGPVRWGGMSVVDGLLRSLRWIETHLTYDWVVHLSGQDYPIRPLGELEERLASGHADAYLRCGRVGSAREVADRADDDYVRRYFFHYYTVPGYRLAGRILRPLLRALRARKGSLQATKLPVYARALPRDEGVRVARRVRRSPFTDDFPCYAGSFWATLSRRAVRHLLETLKQRPEIVRHYRRTMIPDESLVPTVLANDPAIRVVDDPLRYTSWLPGSPHPEVLTTADLDEMATSGHFLARKFDSAAHPEVLDELDRRLGVERHSASACLASSGG